ncbi:D-alanyl-D-alanine carboxypeptidase family protein [Leptolyngbya sp. Cla-17]|uniref:M15 family metallopeptidase n=1 Tax=Leptolyngbya sp. Cla-17 TaxID=2803751 RepID=UPI001F5CB7CA|nr:M15 family metallopeptidase [Leptolyngbya sp. Cla-17]
MDKISALDNSSDVTKHLPDDIPIALRDIPSVAPKPTVDRSMLMAGLTTLGAIALAAGILVAVQLQRSQQAQSSSTAVAANSAQSVTAANPTASPTSTTVNADTMLGHFRYAEATQSELSSVTADGSIKMRKAAAKAYQEMEAAAQQEGVSLVPLSGFRSLTDQDYLFFGKKAERGQVAAERAKVSAPPGYSEHHTGYALDIGDGAVPAMNLSPDFENTPAFKWLKVNAPFHSFELSFPKNNKQGVTYEPWHWRFVGDRASLETFYKARIKK